MFIAEQQLVAAAVGIQVRGWVPFASTFAAFLSRAYDFVRMAAISQANIRLCGSHAGVSIGEDGPSQMALEDIASIRAVHGSTVLYPCDGNQTAKLVAAMADLDGISFMRTTRGNTAVIYGPDEEFPVGGSKVVREGDDVTIIGAGITLHEALKAADALAAEDVSARVIDLYSVKPIDAEGLKQAAQATDGRVLVVEDHWPEGGLGEAVLAALAGEELRFAHLAVREMPGSGKPEELLAAAKIDANAIVEAARKLVSAAARALAHGQLDANRRSAAGDGLHRERAAVRLRDPLAIGTPSPSAITRRRSARAVRRTAIAAESRRLRVRGTADDGAALGLRADLDAAAARGDLDRVRDQIAEQLREPPAVAVDRRDAARAELEGHALLVRHWTRARPPRPRARARRPRPAPARVARLDLRDEQQVLDDAQQALGAPQRDGDEATLLGGQRSALAREHQVEEAAHRRQRRVQLFRDGGDELVLDAPRLALTRGLVLRRRSARAPASSADSTSA